ncbi:putative protein tag-278 [Mizuhopecten yessoensis]|uniref:putative protein tag-278 n=1 Tax=Mizuhopecten yessoensis TaxID=6573 RepID=UPI000B459AA3|nr:putative protein tag-278 [Mizuhopecten yessoensis]
MKTASAVLLFLYVFKLSRAEDCDVRMWYLKMTTKGVFDGELSEEKLFIQKTINDMVLISKKDQTKRKVSCAVLEMYEEMLKPDEEGDAAGTQDDNEEGQGQERNSLDKTEDIESGGREDTESGGREDNESGGRGDTESEGRDDTESGGREDTESGGRASTESEGRDDTESGGREDTGSGGREDTESEGREDTESGGREDTESGESLAGSAVGTENPESKLNEDRLSEDVSALTGDVNDDDTDPIVDDSEETVDHSTDKGTDLHNGLEADETEVFSDDSDGEEEMEEIKELNSNEEHVLSGGSSDDLEKVEHEEIALLTMDELEGTITADGDNSVEIHKEAITTGEGAIGESKEDEEEKHDDPKVPVETEKEPTESESERDKNVDQRQIEQTENENKDKKPAIKDELDTGDSAVVNKKETKEGGLDDASRASENEEEEIDKNNENEDDKKLTDDGKYGGSELENVHRTETESTVILDINGGYGNKESTGGNISELSFNTSATDRDVLKELKSAKGENENNTISFATCRKDRSYRFDIFDHVQKRYSFVENTKHNNKTETHNNTSHGKYTLNQEISRSSLSFPTNLTNSRLVCSPCSLLMKYYTVNTSCSVDTISSIYTQLKSNETQNNQTNTHSNNTESTPGREALNSVKTEETQTNISETLSSTTDADEESKDIESGAKIHDTNVEVLKVTGKHGDEAESKETDETGIDKDRTPGVDSKTASIDTNARNKPTEMEMFENSLVNDQPNEKSLQISNERRSSDEILPPDASLYSLKDDVKSMDVNKGSDEKLSTEENGSAADGTTEHKTGRHGNIETANTITSAETKKGQDTKTNVDKHNDEKFTTAENMLEHKQKTEQVAGTYGNPENDDLTERRNDQPRKAADTTVTNTEAVGTKHRTDQPDKPETTLDEKQTKHEEKQTTAEGKQLTIDEQLSPNQASGIPDNTLILEQLQSNFDHFQKQVVSKTDGYSNKLQTLELMVIRLENQLLKEKLNKNNHSSTITRMENHILRLENELLKLNQSYNEVKKESDSMVQDRKKYLQLGQGSQQTPAYGYSVMRGRAHPVSIDFQAKISYLTNLLNNQSMTIRQLKTRSQYLEDQNRLLYNMIMNQTALMTQIMTRVQDLTEQNIQQRIEAHKIRQQMEQIVSKSSVVETTDKFLLNKLEEMVSDVQKRTIDEDDKVNLGRTKAPTVKDKSEEELEKYMQNESVLPTETWCGPSSGVCIPFSLFQWKTCVESKSDGKETRKSISKLSGIPKGTEHITKRKSTANLSSVDVKQKEEDTSSNDEMKKDFPSTTKVTNTKLDSTQTNTIDTKVKDTPVTEQKERDSNNGVKTQLENKENEKGRDSDAKKSEEIKKEFQNKTSEASAKRTEENPTKVNETTLTEGKTDVKDIVQETPHPTEMEVKSVKDTSQKQGGSGTTTKVSTQPDSGSKVTAHTPDDGGEKIKISPSKEDSNVATTDKSSDEKMSSHINTKADNPGEYAPPETTEKEVSGKELDDKVGELKPSEDTRQQKVTGASKEATLEKGTTSQSPEQKNNKPTESTYKNEENDDTKEVKETNDFKELTKETSVKGDVKDQDRKVKESKTELTKEAIPDLQNKQPKKEIPKAKKDDEAKVVKVKSQEKKPKEPLKKPIKYEADGQKEPKDCYDYYKRGNQKNGVFKIKPYGKQSMVEVFCDMKNGGWTLVHKRQDGTTKFLKKWQDFKEGFGGIRGEHWLGNDHIHYLTNQDHYTLRIELTDWNKTKKVAEYDYFMIDDENEGYRLHIGGYHGDAGDGMAKHNNNKFSTIDVDNDKVTKEFGGSCAKRFSGAWWYYKCYMSNLNGIFYRNGVIPPKLFDGVAWKPWTGSNYSLRSAEMKIRPSNISPK